MGTKLSSPVEQNRFQSFPIDMPNIRGLLAGILGASNIVPSATLLVSVAVIAIVWRMKPSFPLAVIVAILLSYHGLIHDASLFLIPACEIFSSKAAHRLTTIAVAAAVFLSPALFFLLRVHYCWIVLPILALLLALLVENLRFVFSRRPTELSLQGRELRGES
jgi:hypothetical protein